MLLLVLQVGGDRYALDAREIVEVLPMVTIDPLPLSKEGFAGMLEYRGTSVPVVDVSQRLYNRTTRRRLSTRVVIVRHPASDSRLLGLLVEKATETMRREPTDFIETGAGNEVAAHLGPMTRDAQGLVHRLELERLIVGG
jgi:chemotaxis-related protein WspB